MTTALPISFAGIPWVEGGGFLGQKLVGEARKTLGTRIGHKLELQIEYVAVEEVSCLGHSICRTNHSRTLCSLGVTLLGLGAVPHISPQFSTRPMRAIYESSSLAGHGWRECQTLCRCQRCLNASELCQAADHPCSVLRGVKAARRPRCSNAVARCLDRTGAGLPLSRDHPDRQPCDSWHVRLQ